MGTDLDHEDYLILMKWFEFKFARDKAEKIPVADRRVFWKLTFVIVINCLMWPPHASQMYCCYLPGVKEDRVFPSTGIA